MDIGKDWLGGQGFPYRASRLYFLRYVAKAELQGYDWSMLGFFNRCDLGLDL